MGKTGKRKLPPFFDYHKNTMDRLAEEQASARLKGMYEENIRRKKNAESKPKDPQADPEWIAGYRGEKTVPRKHGTIVVRDNTQVAPVYKTVSTARTRTEPVNMHSPMYSAGRMARARDEAGVSWKGARAFFGPGVARPMVDPRDRARYDKIMAKLRAGKLDGMSAKESGLEFTNREGGRGIRMNMDAPPTREEMLAMRAKKEAQRREREERDAETERRAVEAALKASGRKGSGTGIPGLPTQNASTPENIIRSVRKGLRPPGGPSVADEVAELAGIGRRGKTGGGRGDGQRASMPTPEGRDRIETVKSHTTKSHTTKSHTTVGAGKETRKPGPTKLGATTVLQGPIRHDRVVRVQIPGSTETMMLPESQTVRVMRGGRMYRIPKDVKSPIWEWIKTRKKSRELSRPPYLARYM